MATQRDFVTAALETFPCHIRFAGRFALTAPWGLSLSGGLGAVCVVVGGPCWLATAGVGAPITPAAGDVVVLSPTAGHCLQAPPGSRLAGVQELIAAIPPDTPAVLGWGGGGCPTTLLGGVFHFPGSGLNPLTAALPPVVHLRKQAVDQRDLFPELIRLIEQELRAGQAGAGSVLKRLVEILLIQAIRAGLGDSALRRWDRPINNLPPELWPALAVMHQHPEQYWTVAALAEQAVMSRSAFSATFVQAVGKPPGRYLREQRMELACRLLRTTALGLKEIAAQTGYDSVTAFSTAFKRLAGTAPGTYRRRGAPDEGRRQL